MTMRPSKGIPVERLLHDRLAGVAGARLVTAPEPATHGQRSGLGCAKQLEAAVPAADHPLRRRDATRCRAHRLQRTPLHDPDELLAGDRRR